MACATSIGFEQGDSSGPTGVGKDLGELWKQDGQQRLDLIFVACDFIGELAMQPYQLSIGRNQFRRRIATLRFSVSRTSRAIVVASKWSVFARKPRC